MSDYKKLITALEKCTKVPGFCDGCPYGHYDEYVRQIRDCSERLELDALKIIKSLYLLVEWAEECDFGYDQFPDEYEKYRNEIQDMNYIDGLIHVAMRTLEDHGEFDN